MQVVMRMLYFISGIFFSSTMLPPVAAKYLLYNPLLDLVETVRNSFIPSVVVMNGHVVPWAGLDANDQLSLGYGALWSMGMLLVGLAAMRGWGQKVLER